MNAANPHPGAPVDPTGAPSIGGWRLVELIGRGGMGEVYRAEREGPAGVRRRAALKRILPKLQGDPTLRGRFVSEARINARLEHPNIVQVLDFGDDPEPYLALEYVDGTSVARVLRHCAERGVAVPPVAAAYIIAEAATGLDYAHRRLGDDGQPLQIVHRDVSPQNLLISVEGAVKVSDFGIARAADNQLRTAAGITVGKIAYMAPEVAQGQPFDWRADVFALAVVLWETLLTRPLIPRNDPNAAIQVLFSGQFEPPSRVNPSIPAELDAIVLNALAVDPARRTASAGLLAQQLKGFVHTVAPSFDGAELARALAPLAPDVRWQVPQRPAHPRQATMPPPTRADALGGVPAGIPSAGPAMIPPAAPPPMAPPMAPPPAAPPMAPPMAPPPAGPQWGNPAPLDQGPGGYQPPPRPAYDAPPPVAPAPPPVVQAAPKQGLSTRAITAILALVMVAAALGVYAWLTASNDRRRAPPPAAHTDLVPAAPSTPAALPPPSNPITPEPAPTPARDYAPQARAALDAVETTVQACLQRDRSVAEQVDATVTFDNATGHARTPEVSLRGARGRTTRLVECVTGALRGASFTADAGATGTTVVTRSWPMRARPSRRPGEGNGSTILFPFGTRH